MPHSSKLHEQNASEELNNLVTSQLLPMWMGDSKSPATIKHIMDIIRRAVSFLNPGQVPVAFDQPLFTIAKRVQWLCPELYGEGK